MERHFRVTAKCLLFPLAQIGLPVSAQAGFFEDGKANVELRNFYINRDFSQTNTSQSKHEEWAQGFLLRYASGFTTGSVGFGLDAIALAGLKLDSSLGRAGSGLLPRQRDGRSVDESGSLGLTAKVRASKSLLRIGTLHPRLPVAHFNDTRLLPQTFEGVHLNSQELASLIFDAGQIRQVTQRDSTDREDLRPAVASAKAIRVSKGATTDKFNFAGVGYKWSPQLSANYFYGELDRFYRQHSFSLLHLLPLGDGQSLKSDLRYASSTNQGDSNIDNTALGAMLTYSLGGHAFGLGFQKMSGDTGYAYIHGSNAFLPNFVANNDFANRDEQSWQVRYDFNFAAAGIPGLTFMTRYIYGSEIELGAGRPIGSEWERDMDITYVFQSGVLKNLGLMWRNSSLRTNHFGSDLDDNRLIISYTLPLL
ncbi:OprD family porin [Pseudomonas sp. L13]|uniref:OprD family porin n=1 Tax=Pseudomonas sp. L13 TaxID=343985 RepID=UPI00137B0179|nr:OprD family porin [Pseudomonas sp. L13]NCE89377.1 outer membrane porin, OprD family [Pseudomonas sp. L13]